MVRQLRRICVAFVGGIVVALGIAMLVLPGSAVLVIPAGLAILATEFPWARRLLHRVRHTLDRSVTLFKRRGPSTPPSPHREKTSTPSSEVSRSSELRAS